MSRAFDAIGASYDEAFADKPGQVAAGRWLISQIKGDRVVLDVGCGVRHEVACIASGLSKGGRLMSTL